ncbi:MAG TPA: amino acid ABC transporter ATP-binding protein, partial [Cryomorphaceae bacterium]|nr:amino acid ABC transporter ATP-binding protein [Cryomorphaceae bacterium]
MICLQNIHKSFGKTEVLKGITLQVRKGETLVLLGLSGSGKTTTLKLINGLER